MARDRLAAIRDQQRQQSPPNPASQPTFESSAYDYPSQQQRSQYQTEPRAVSPEDLRNPRHESYMDVTGDYYGGDYSESPPRETAPLYSSEASYDPSSRTVGLPSGPRQNLSSRTRPNNPPPLPSVNNTNPTFTSTPKVGGRQPSQPMSYVSRAARTSSAHWQRDENGFSQGYQSTQAPAMPQPRYDDASLYEKPPRELVPRQQYNKHPQRSQYDGYENEKAGGSPRSEESYEMKPRSGRRNAIKAGDVPFEETGEFFVEIDSIQQGLRDGNDMIKNVETLHTQLFSFPSSDSREAIQVANELQHLSASARTHFASLKVRIKVLDQGNANLRALIPVGQSIHKLSMADVGVRKTQVDALKEKFKSAIQRYTTVEKDSRQKNRVRIQRQVQMLYPEMDKAALEEEVRAVENGGEGVFTQALRNQRSNQARNALRDVQSRAADIAQIEKTLIELAQMFQDMSTLVEAQDIQIVEVERGAINADTDMKEGLDQTKKAVVSARKARKWRWVCCGIFVLILIVVAIVVVFQVVLPLIKKNNAAAAKEAAASSSSSSRIASSAPPTIAPSDAASSTPASDAIPSAASGVDDGNASPTAPVDANANADPAPTSFGPGESVINTIPIDEGVTYAAGSGNGGFLPQATAAARMRKMHRRLRA